MVSTPILVPAAAGVKKSEIGQKFAPAVTGGMGKPQSLVSEKSPVATTLLAATAWLLRFVKTTCWDELGVPTTCAANVSDVGFTATPGAAKPVPVRLIICGLPGDVSVTVIVSVRLPATVGAKVTVTIHLVAGPNVVRQLLVWLKSPAVIAILLIEMSPEALVLPTSS
jgi:hypothetical protein